MPPSTAETTYANAASERESSEDVGGHEASPDGWKSTRLIRIERSAPALAGLLDPRGGDGPGVVAAFDRGPRLELRAADRDAVKSVSAVASASFAECAKARALARLPSAALGMLPEIASSQAGGP